MTERVNIRRFVVILLIYYFGTNLGASIEEGSEEGINLVRTIVSQAVHPVISSDKVRPRLIESAKGTLLIVFNDQTTDQQARIHVHSRHQSATNIYNNQSQTVSDGTVEVQVPFRVSVFIGLTCLRFPHGDLWT